MGLCQWRRGHVRSREVGRDPGGQANAEGSVWGHARGGRGECMRLRLKEKGTIWCRGMGSGRD